MEKAAAHLTPVTLELGWEKPCMWTERPASKLAAKRIVFGEISQRRPDLRGPDYLLGHREVKNELVACMRRCLLWFYGKNPIDNPHYPKIINENTFYVSKDCWKTNTFYWAARTTARIKLHQPYWMPYRPDAPVMQEEIFWSDSSDPDLLDIG